MWVLMVLSTSGPSRVPWLQMLNCRAPVLPDHRAQVPSPSDSDADGSKDSALRLAVLMADVEPFATDEQFEIGDLTDQEWQVFVEALGEGPVPIDTTS